MFTTSCCDAVAGSILAQAETEEKVYISYPCGETSNGEGNRPIVSERLASVRRRQHLKAKHLPSVQDKKILVVSQGSDSWDPQKFSQASGCCM